MKREEFGAEGSLGERNRRMQGLEELKGRTLVYGLGVSGQAAARLVDALGGRLGYYDDGKREGLLNDLPQGGEAPFAFEKVPADFIRHFERVVVSPGVKPCARGLAPFREAGLPIFGELELAWRFCRVPVVAVTGTNGKSTAVTMVAETLRQAGFKAKCAGNIGTAMSDVVLDDSLDILVVEVSSFQLEWVKSFHPKVAVMTSFAGDHLDWHPDEAAYLAAKLRLAEHCTKEDVLVYPAGLAPVEAGWSKLPCKRLRMADNGGDCDVRFHREAYALCTPQWRLELGQVAAELSYEPAVVYGAIQVAAAVATVYETGPDAVTAMLRAFRPLPHRQEAVREFEGILYVDDSKATNVEATCYALGCSRRPVVLILGGRDKGVPYTPIVEAGGDKLRQVIALGEATEAIRADLGGKLPLIAATGLEGAVFMARQLAEPGDTVLLSPACSSFDMFTNYKLRGKAFRKIVEDL